MQIILERDFIKSAKKLPANVKKKLSKLLTILSDNPLDPSLHSKKLTGELTGLFSFRITREWRVLYYFNDPETIRVLDVGHRKDIYK